MNNSLIKYDFFDIQNSGETGIINELDRILSCFDDADTLQVLLKNGEMFYYEAVKRGYRMSFEEHKSMGLRFYGVSGIWKPYSTEDFIEYKGPINNAKTRFLIWVAAIYFKYDQPVPEFIRQKIIQLSHHDFDVLARHEKPMKFMSHKNISE